MAWADSHVFRQWLADSVGRTAAFDMDSDALKAALFNNTPTPDRNVTAAASAYGSGVWLTGSETFEAGQWNAGGVQLTGQTVNVGTPNVVFFDANDTASGAAADLTNATGALVYDSTLAAPVANQGVCFNYFGGPNSVVNGTFTVIWNVFGLWRATV